MNSVQRGKIKESNFLRVLKEFLSSFICRVFTENGRWRLFIFFYPFYFLAMFVFIYYPFNSPIWYPFIHAYYGGKSLFSCLSCLQYGLWFLKGTPQEIATGKNQSLEKINAPPKKIKTVFVFWACERPLLAVSPSPNSVHGDEWVINLMRWLNACW